MPPLSTSVSVQSCVETLVASTPENTEDPKLLERLAPQACESASQNPENFLAEAQKNLLQMLEGKVCINTPPSALPVIKLDQIISTCGPEFPIEEVTLRDDLYHRTKTYLAIPLRYLLEKLDTGESNTQIVFRSSDGYSPKLSWDKAKVAEGFLTIGEPGAGGLGHFEPMPHRSEILDPGPFYLVWKGLPESDQIYPWPYQLETISLERIIPDQVQFPNTSKETLQGAKLFQDHCATCHTIHGEGGKVGPDLNEPNNVTEYWKRESLTQLLQDPRSISVGRRMPGFALLGGSNIQLILNFLEYLSDQKKHP